MLDLSDAGLARWWRSRPRKLVDIVETQEGRESWVIDGVGRGAAAVGGFVRLAEASERRADDLPARFSDNGFVARLRTVLAFMRSGRRLRYVEWIAALPRGAEMLERLLSVRGADPGGLDAMSGEVLRGSIVALDRASVLRDLLSPDRLERVLRAVRNV